MTVMAQTIVCFIYEADLEEPGMNSNELTILPMTFVQPCVDLDIDYIWFYGDLDIGYIWFYGDLDIRYSCVHRHPPY